MALRGADLTAESVDRIRGHLSALAGRAGYRERALGGADPTGLALAAPHDVYVLGLEDVAHGASLEAAKLVGRRVLVMDGADAIASAEYSGHDESDRFESNEGPYVAATAAAITRAESDDKLAGADYEVRALRIPGLYFMGLWLKNEGAGDDVVIPLEPAPGSLEPGRAYAPAELLSTLAEPARARLQFDDVGGGEPAA